jgi:hypothetical protein
MPFNPLSPSFRHPRQFFTPKRTHYYNEVLTQYQYIMSTEPAILEILDKNLEKMFDSAGDIL